MDRTLHGTKEISLEVSDFENACALFEATGLVVKAYQETKREKWQVENCEVTIDTWPWIPTFVEIEGPSEEVVRTTAGQLGFEWGDALFGSVENAYQTYFEATEEEIDSWPEIVFSPVPEWLEKKRKSNGPSLARGSSAWIREWGMRKFPPEPPPQENPHLYGGFKLSTARRN